METNGITGAREQLLALRRSKVQTSIGIEHTVRALGFAELSALHGGLLDVSTLLKAVKKAKDEAAGFTLGAQDLATLAKIEPVIVAGCVDPKYGTDPATDPVPSDLPIDDRLSVFTAICMLSGYSKEAAEKVRP